MRLCIAEKPSVAKEIAQIIGATTRHDGYYEGNGYQVSWTFGHLCTLKEPNDYTQDWKWWKLTSLPMIPERFGIKLIDNKGVEKQFNTIKKLVDTCEEVINCGDAGIEGELIQRWVLQKAQCKVPIKRLWISSLTEEAIKEGFKHLKEGSNYDKLYAAGNARSIGDWLLGMNATRLYTLKYASGKAVLSIGRVQTPTLALIVNRFNEIQNFVPQTYWELKTKYKDVWFSSNKGRFDTVNDAVEILEQIKLSEFEIMSFTKKKGKESAPKLFDLTALQVECNKKFGFSADDTLQYIQNLYEKKMVTYPRVDTTYLPTDMYPKIEGILANLKPYSNFTEPLLKEKIRKSTKVFDDKKITDHHAIIPTGEAPSGLNHNQKQVYDTITRRFIANFYPDCEVSNTTVIGQAGGFEFKATGKEILKEGWRELYPSKGIADADENADSQTMPTFQEHEKGPHFPDLSEKQTSPPKMHTEATLLRAMETAGKQVEDEELRDLMKDNGIGRPSTRANIIETLFKRNYIIRVGKNLTPTNTGIQLIATISNDLLKSVELTGQWERKLREIEKGNYEPSLFMEEMKTMVITLVQDVKREEHKTIAIQETPKNTEEKLSESKKTKTPKSQAPVEINCPKCKIGKMLKGKAAFGCSAYKEGCNFKVPFDFAGKKLSDKQLETILLKGKSSLIKGLDHEGKKVQGRIVLNNEFLTTIEIEEISPIEEPKELNCPKCNKGIIVRGKAAFGCTEYKNGCDFRIPFDLLIEKFGSDVLTAKELKQIDSL